LIKLLDLSNKQLSKGIKSLSPVLYDGIKIENTLLDGSLHIQTIGEPQEYINFDVLANHNQVDDINYLNSLGGQLKLIVDDKYYIGHLYVSGWERVTVRHTNELNRLYTSNVKLVISQSGVV